MCIRDRPWAAGLGFCVAMEKPDFLGKAALAQTRGKQPTRLVTVVVDSPDAPRMIHDEPIFSAGCQIGLTTSAAWGHRLDQNLAIASVTREPAVTTRFLAESSFEIEIAGQRYPAQLQLGAPYDPSGSRMKC